MPGLGSVISLGRTAVKVSVELTTAVLGRVVEEVERRVSSRPDSAAPGPDPAPPAAAPAVDVYDATPPEPLVEQPTPDVPDEIVAESSDPGAAGGAGATIHVDEPWDGYKDMTAAAIVDRLVVADAATLAAIRLYESQHRKRKTLLAEVDKRFGMQ